MIDRTLDTLVKLDADEVARIAATRSRYGQRIRRDQDAPIRTDYEVLGVIGELVAERTIGVACERSARVDRGADGSIDGIFGALLADVKCSDHASGDLRVSHKAKMVADVLVKVQAVPADHPDFPAGWLAGWYPTLGALEWPLRDRGNAYGPSRDIAGDALLSPRALAFFPPRRVWSVRPTITAHGVEIAADLSIPDPETGELDDIGGVYSGTRGAFAGEPEREVWYPWGYCRIRGAFYTRDGGLATLAANYALRRAGLEVIEWGMLG